MRAKITTCYFWKSSDFGQKQHCACNSGSGSTARARGGARPRPPRASQSRVPWGGRRARERRSVNCKSIVITQRASLSPHHRPFPPNGVIRAFAHTATDPATRACWLSQQPGDCSLFGLTRSISSGRPAPPPGAGSLPLPAALLPV